MGDLSKNLSRSEFACKCGCGFDTVDMETIDVIQDVCDNFNVRVDINSGCRCPSHNRDVLGSSNSHHLRARASDCAFRDISSLAVHDYLLVKYPDRYGFGVYTEFNHIDTRSNGPARWSKL